MLERSWSVKRRFSSRARAQWRAAGLILLIALASILGCRTAPIQDVIDAPLPSAGAAVDLDAVDEAIWRAGRRIGWEIERIAPGELRGIWRYRHHLAVVRIHHDGRHLSIRYEDSANLLREGQQIHRNYNRVVQRLLQAIQQELVTPTP